MGNELNVELKELKACAGEVNALEMKDISIKVNFNSGPAIAIEFLDACDAVSLIDESKLSDESIVIYNKLPSKSDLNAMITKRDAEKGKKAKGKSKSKADADGTVKEKKKADADGTVKEKKKADPKPKSRYGHILSAKSGKLDDALYEGGTMEDIMKAIDVPRTRFVGHSNHLKNDLGLTLVIKADKDKNTLKDHYKIKEESITK